MRVVGEAKVEAFSGRGVLGRNWEDGSFLLETIVSEAVEEVEEIGDFVDG